MLSDRLLLGLSMIYAGPARAHSLSASTVHARSTRGMPHSALLCLCLCRSRKALSRASKLCSVQAQLSSGTIAAELLLPHSEYHHGHGEAGSAAHLHVPGRRNPLLMHVPTRQCLLLTVFDLHAAVLYLHVRRRSLVAAQKVHF